MYIYVDESGCPGRNTGSSPLFTLTGVVLADQAAAKQVRSAISGLRASLGWNPKHEFKYSKTDHLRQRLFFEAVRVHPFRFYAFTLNKAGLFPIAMNDPKKLYRKVSSWTLENILNGTDATRPPSHVSIVFDSCGNREFYEPFRKYAAATIQYKVGDRCTCLVDAADSKSDDLLQLADMVCGAVAGSRKGRKESGSQLAMIAKQCAQMRYWP